MPELLYYFEKWAKYVLFFWCCENTGLGLSVSDRFNFLAWDNVRLNTDRWCVDN
jgi:hypothetical protein